METVAFVFESSTLSTEELIIEDIAKKSEGQNQKQNPRPSSTPQRRTDYEIFKQVFKPEEIQKFLRQPDPRLDIKHITH